MKTAKELREIAEAATQGPFCLGKEGWKQQVWLDDDTYRTWVSVAASNSKNPEADCVFISTFDPPTSLAFVTLLEAAQKRHGFDHWLDSAQGRFARCKCGVPGCEVLAALKPWSDDE